MIFIAKDVSRMVFEDGCFGGTQNIWGNSYLNITTVQFDCALFSDNQHKCYFIHRSAPHITAFVINHQLMHYNCTRYMDEMCITKLDTDLMVV